MKVILRTRDGVCADAGILCIAGEGSVGRWACPDDTRQPLDDPL